MTGHALTNHAGGSPRRNCSTARPSQSASHGSLHSHPVVDQHAVIFLNFINCSIFGLDNGFVIKSAGFTFVPTFFVTTFPDLEASCKAF